MWHGDDNGVVDGGGASLTERQFDGEASAIGELNLEFRRLGRERQGGVGEITWLPWWETNG